ncbi:MAG: helix-turn-helix domain-containing protein [Faecalimonas umbilicata]|uniref:helix-turn-helix domain-containing protein n=1 Tax=Faecalimonas umbilicata TaxID=1912855 RepID=UPI0039A3C717
MSFCDDIKIVRQRSLMSQETFAQTLGVSFTTVNRWETGKSKPSYKTMKLINEFCKKNGIDFDITKELMEVSNYK